METTSNPADQPTATSVAEAKARFFELIDRVATGERFVLYRDDKPAATLVPPAEGLRGPAKPSGLLTIVGGLADFEELDAMIDEIYTNRTRSRDCEPPEFG